MLFTSDAPILIQRGLSFTHMYVRRLTSAPPQSGHNACNDRRALVSSAPGGRCSALWHSTQSLLFLEVHASAITPVCWTVGLVLLSLRFCDHLRWQIPLFWLFCGRAEIQSPDNHFHTVPSEVHWILPAVAECASVFWTFRVGPPNEKIKHTFLTLVLSRKCVFNCDPQIHTHPVNM